MTLEQFFAENPKVALAFSGGADSAYLLYAAIANGAEVRAYYVKTPFQPQFEYDDALRLARELGADMTAVTVDVLADPVIAANPENRCYYCKKKLFSAILEQAEQDGFPLVIDGTNASDDCAERPGMQALKELGVLSPLRLCGLTKPEIRRLSKEARLFTHDKPAYACLATRIPAGTEITPGLLKKTENSEAFLQSLGFSDLRIRILGGAAKIQVKKNQLPLLMARRQEILEKLKEDYTAVLLDLEVRE